MKFSSVQKYISSRDHHLHHQLKMWKFLRDSSAAVLLLMIGAAFMPVTHGGCQRTPWVQRKQSCSDAFPWINTRLIYTDQNALGLYSSLCCELDFFNDDSEVERCNTIECLPASLGTFNICPRRTVGDRTILFEEVIRDNCVLANGQPGFVAQCCGLNSTEGMLLSTYGAELNEFPHQAGLTGGCGGTVYNERYILTAAHCVINAATGLVRDESEIQVQLGTNIGGHSGFDSKDTKYGVEKIIYHQNYSKLQDNIDFWLGANGRYFNDIALLRLNRSVEFGEHVKSLQIAPEGFRPLEYSAKVVIAGWGMNDNLQQSQHLQKANVILQSDQSCFEYNGGQSPWPNYGDKKDQLLCLGGIMNGVYSPSASPGDSGGPAICRGPDGYAVLCGITSFGKYTQRECVAYSSEETCLPAGYVEVASFRDWIVEKAGVQNESTFFRYKLYGDDDVDDDIPADKYNHQVHITSTSGKSCGGTLVSQNTVVTAAQCVVRNDGSRRQHDNLQVTFGMKKLGNMGKGLGVKEVIPLDGFERVGEPVDPTNQREHGYSHILMTDNYHKRDLAVVKLAGKFDIPSSHLPNLPSSVQEPSGFGTELAFPRNTTTRSSSKLMRREFKIVPSDSCRKRLRRLSRMGVKTNLDDDVICAVEKFSGGSTCDRELGGGLICKGDQGEDVLCGVQIFRLCSMAVPNGFINVGRHASWLRSNAL